MSGYYNRNNRGNTKKLGPVTAYADAVLAGYTGTREQWAQDMAKLGQNVTQVAQNTKLTTELAEQTRVNTEQVAKYTADVRKLAKETSDNAVRVAGNTAESNRLAEETKQAAAQAKEDAEYAGAAADNFRVDTTLSEEGKAAEAKKTGEKFAQLSEEIAEYNAFINRRNLLANPCFIEEFGEWIFKNDGVTSNTAEYVKTNSICQAVHAVSNGEQPLQIINVLKKSDIVSGRYIAKITIPSGSVGWHRINICAVNELGEIAKTIYQGEASKNFGTYEVEFNIGENDITTDYLGFYISMVDACDCIVTEPYLGIKSDYNDFYAQEIYRLPIPEIPYNKIKNVEVKPEDTTFAEHRTSANIFNPNSTEIVDGYYIDPSSHAFVASSKNFYTFVPLDGAGTYIFKTIASTFGLYNSERINMYGVDKQYIKTIQAVGNDTETSTLHEVTLTITEQDILEGCYYIGYSQSISNKPLLMIVKDIPYPTQYVPYLDEIHIPNLSVVNNNPLHGKMVVFDGDSICNASSETTETTNRGWAYRIGNANRMTWVNVGIGGGVITNGISADKHCLCTYIDTIHANYPDLDYFIFDGGTNDADLLNSTSEKYGNIVDGDFSGNYDDTTFCGAFETLIYKALNYFPKAKIGWIIAQKMGGSTSEYMPDGKRYKFFEMGMKVCKKWGIPYINLWDEGQINPMLSVYYDSSLNAQENKEAGKAYIDGQHLTAVGYDIISPKIEAWMRTL